MTTPTFDLLPATSTVDLEDELRHCQEHGEYWAKGKRYTIGGIARDIFSRCPRCEEDQRDKEASEVQAKVAQATKVDMERLLGQTMIPARFVGRTFENYRAEQGTKAFSVKDTCYTFAKEFDRNLKIGASLVLSGKPGTGKSHLAAAILQGILPKHVGAYVTLMDLIRKVRETWRRDSERTESQLLNELTEIPLLVIDEIGVQYGTDGERAVLFDVMDRRYREMRPTILMTNLDREGFRESVGDRVYDRLIETGKWVSFDWDSYRGQARKEMAGK